MTTVEFAAGGYRYIPGVFQYSGGVAASPGFTIRRVRLHTPLPVAAGFGAIARFITAAGRPLTSFCACELRSPAPFDDSGFRAFNESYVVTLREWGIMQDQLNPVARSNVCPEIEPPGEPSFHAFSFTMKAADAAPMQGPSFVVAGSGEAREGGGLYAARTVRHGETSAEAMREKAVFVLGEMERRLALLGAAGGVSWGATWAAATATQVYTVHDLFPFLADEIVRRGAARAGLTWHFCRPPVRGLEFEMDCRGVGWEEVI
jgi:hypothetical protein